MIPLTNPNSVLGLVPQSPPVDLSQPYSASWVRGKTIAITGGSSGFGADFFRTWATNGANVIIGDISDAQGRALVEEVRKQTGNHNHQYVHCDVTNWQSQIDFFREATKLSPHGGIDAIVANAGIIDSDTTFLEPRIEDEEPRAPTWSCLDVNLIGAMYTAHIAMHYLPRNPQSNPANPNSTPASQSRDRHLLLLGSIASVGPVPGQLVYCVAKHGIMGLFRTLRVSARGIRVNMICPYFVDSQMLTSVGRVILAGGALVEQKDVVDAATRLMADTRIVGRALGVGPKVRVNEQGEVVPKKATDGVEKAVWEVYADDFEHTEVFVRRIVGYINGVQVVRGWAGFFLDIWRTICGSYMGTHRVV